eukprot:TRINITY_DN1343_c0_g1_i7.p1 TRINITY_DN1343_c0_g1~~TRINITY_DN1343_c0_g1_i7.p1  ORF type:complete len:129 (+),score=29.90 TRINITY_DN1343_c0_g1_i7:66-452(+)
MGNLCCRDDENEGSHDDLLMLEMRGRNSLSGIHYREMVEPVEEFHFHNIEELRSKRDEFWATQPSYGGSKDIWDTLKAAIEMEDKEFGDVILQTAGIVRPKNDFTEVYDELGFRYEIPSFIYSTPTFD